MFYMIASFNFNLKNFSSLEEAERHYSEYHIPHARQLAGLRHYVVGRPVDFGGAKADRDRTILFAFDDADAYKAAFRTELGRICLEDQKLLLTDVIVTFMNAEQIVPG